MSFRPPLPFDELLQFRVQPAGNGNLNRMFDLDTLSRVVTELSDKHQTVREVSLNPPAREPGGLGKAGQLPARETFQHGAPELRANQPLPGEACEYSDSEVGEPVALDIGDDHRPLGDPRKPGEELCG